MFQPGTFDGVAAYLETLFQCHWSAVGSSIALTSSEQAFVQSATNQQAALRNLYDQQYYFVRCSTQLSNEEENAIRYAIADILQNDGCFFCTILSNPIVHIYREVSAKIAPWM